MHPPARTCTHLTSIFALPKPKLSRFVLLPDGHMSAAVTQFHGGGDALWQGASFKKDSSSVGIFFCFFVFTHIHTLVKRKRWCKHSKLPDPSDQSSSPLWHLITLISFNPHSRFAAILFYYEFHCCWFSVFYSWCTAWTCLCMLWGFKQYGEAWLALFRQAVNSQSRGLPGPPLICHLYSYIHISIEVQYAFTRQVCLYI